MFVKSEHEETIRYATDPLYSQLQTLRDPIDDNGSDEIVRLKDGLQNELGSGETSTGWIPLRDYATSPLTRVPPRRPGTD